MPVDTYLAFGLTLASELPLPELSVAGATGEPDAVLRLGAVPEHLSDASDAGICYETAPGRALITLDGVARFLVADGRAITIDPECDVPEDTLRLFALGMCIGLLIHQRGDLVLHASAVSKNGHTIALSGPSSVGKTTLAASFLRRGYALITDEVCRIVLRDDRAHVAPGRPTLLLWRRALVEFGFYSDDLTRVRPELEKYIYNVNGQFDAVARPLDALYHLDSWNREEVELTKLQGFDRFNALLDDTYKEQYLKGMGLIRQRQTHCARLAPQILVRRLSWPQRWDDLDEAVDLIENDILQDFSVVNI